MALTYPLDILDGWPGWTTGFALQWRQEQSRTGAGRTLVKDLGSPLWRMTATTASLSPNRLDHWRARLDALENGLQTFKGVKLSRCYPILYPSGTWPTGSSFSGDSAAIHTVGEDNKSIRVKDLPAGFVLSVGDMIRIGTADLHEVMETATADGSGVTPAFEVRPHLWPGVEADDPVSVKRPYCLMTIVPDSISSPADLATGRGSISFEALEAR